MFYLQCSIGGQFQGIRAARQLAAEYHHFDVNKNRAKQGALTNENQERAKNLMEIVLQMIYHAPKFKRLIIIKIQTTNHHLEETCTQIYNKY